MKKIILGLFVLVLLFTLSGCVEQEQSLYTNDVLYNCTAGDYSFPNDDLVFEKVSDVGLLDYQSSSKSTENKCIFTVDYKFKVAPTDNPYYEIDFDTCKLTMSQLSYFKAKNADLMTMLKDADCVGKTVPFIEKAIKPLDFKGQVKTILGNLGTSHAQFLASFESWANSVISYEDFQEDIKNEKITASKAFKDLQDLTPQPEEVELKNKAIKVVELYLDSLNSLEDALSKQSSADFESSMDKSTAQMDEATKEIFDLAKLLENK